MERIVGDASSTRTDGVQYVARAAAGNGRFEVVPSIEDEWAAAIHRAFRGRPSTKGERAAAGNGRFRVVSDTRLRERSISVAKD